jgi:hypothetical protein
VFNNLTITLTSKEIEDLLRRELKQHHLNHDVVSVKFKNSYKYDCRNQPYDYSLDSCDIVISKKKTEF